MKFNKMDDDHNLIICTPQYLKHYEEALRSHYPNHEIEPSTLCSHGQAYLFNKQKLIKRSKEMEADLNLWSKERF